MGRSGFFSKGFSLIETAIVVVIVGFLVNALLRFVPVIVTQMEQRKQEARYDIARSGLYSFITRDEDDDPATPGTLSRYPCPAPFSAVPTDPEYGTEQRDAVTGECIATADGSNGIFDVPGAYIGALPTSSLRISSINMLDAYGNRLTYAISKDFVRDNALNDPLLTGSITIEQESGVTIPDAPFALISHGAGGAGAYNASGGLVNPCNVATEDSENCDYDDAVFLEAELSTGTESSFYDDRMAFSLVDEEDDEFWAPIPGSIDDITNKNLGLVCVGPSCDPGAARTGDVVLASGNLHATDDVIADRDILAGQDLSATRGLIVGGVSGDPDTIGTGTIVAGTGIVAIPTENGNIVAENDLIAGGNIITQNGLIQMKGSPVINFDQNSGEFNVGGIEPGGPNYVGLYTNNVNRLRILPDGNVGIGTTSPAQKLHVLGNVIIGDTSVTGTAHELRIIGDGPRIQLKDNDGSAIDRTWEISVNDAIGNFSIRDADAGTQPFTVAPDSPSFTTYLTSEGRVGIGTDNPSAKLEINSAPGETGLKIATESTAPNNAPIAIALFNSESSISYELYTDYSNGFRIHRSIGASDDFAISSNGNVGVGTISPKTKLDIAGEVKISSTGVACSATNEGAFRYNSSVKAMEYCDGAGWKPFGSGGGCSSQTGESCFCTPSLDGRITCSGSCNCDGT